MKTTLLYLGILLSLLVYSCEDPNAEVIERVDTLYLAPSEGLGNVVIKNLTDKDYNEYPSILPVSSLTQGFHVTSSSLDTLDFMVNTPYEGFEYFSFSVGVREFKESLIPNVEPGMYVLDMLIQDPNSGGILDRTYSVVEVIKNETVVVEIDFKEGELQQSYYDYLNR